MAVYDCAGKGADDGADEEAVSIFACYIARKEGSNACCDLPQSNQ
jgi:hypothetical protein